MNHWFDSIEKKMGSDFRDAFEEAFFMSMKALTIMFIVMEFVAAIAIPFVALFAEMPMFLLWLIPLGVVIALTIFGFCFLDALGV